MKNIQQTINESRGVNFRVSFSNALDNDKLPINATITVEPRDKDNFLNYLKSEVGNTFSNAEDYNGNIIEP